MFTQCNINIPGIDSKSTFYQVLFECIMHYLSSSSSSSDIEPSLTTNQQDIQQYGYERGYTQHDELTKSSSSDSAVTDYYAILFGDDSDTSDTEQPIQNVDYSEFDSTLIPISSQNPLTSTQNQQSLSIHLQVSHLEVLSVIEVGNLSVNQPDDLSLIHGTR